MTDFERTFAEFAARKTRRAASATLPPYKTTFDCHPADAAAIGNDWSRALFDGPFYQSPVPRGVPACNLVFVQSRNGNTGAANPADLGGGDTDAHLIYEGLSRVAADAVLTGAETIRGSQLVFSVWHPELVALRRDLGLPRHPAQIVATLRGLDIAGGLMFNLPDVPVYLLTVCTCREVMAEAVAARPWISVIEMDTPGQLRDAFVRLRAAGVTRISAIGGRTVARQLIDTGLVQDLYLTTSPRDGGNPDTPLYPGPLPGEVVLRKRGTGPEEGVIFEHFHLRALSSRSHEEHEAHDIL